MAEEFIDKRRFISYTRRERTKYEGKFIERHNTGMDTTENQEKTDAFSQDAAERQVRNIALDVFSGNLLESETTSILSAVLSDESTSVTDKLKPIGWTGTQFSRSFSLAEFESCFTPATGLTGIHTNATPRAPSPTAPSKGYRVTSRGKISLGYHHLDVQFPDLAAVWAYVKEQRLEVNEDGLLQIVVDRVLAVLLNASAGSMSKPLAIGDQIGKHSCNLRLQRLAYPMSL